MTNPTDPSRLDLLDLLAVADGQEWFDLYENPAQQQIAETMYGRQANHILGSSWLYQIKAAAARSGTDTQTRADDGIRALDGWVPFGYHVVDGPCPPVVFSDDRNTDDGLPEWEHLDHEQFPAWINGLRAEALVEAAETMSDLVPDDSNRFVARGIGRCVRFLEDRARGLSGTSETKP